MGDFFLTPMSIPLLAKFLLSITITCYILFFIPKSKTVSWFTAYLICYTLLDFFAFLGQTIHSELNELSLPLQYLSGFGMAFSFVQFAYLFNENFFRRERDRFNYLFGAIGICCFLYILFAMSKIGLGDYTEIQTFAFYPLTCLLWATIIFYRKYRKAQKDNPQHKSRYLSFFALSALAIAVSFSVVFKALGLISSTANMIIFFVLNLIIITLLTVNFINYLAEKTTVLVKLIGLSLVLFITVIGLQGILIIPELDSESSANIVLSTQALQQVHNQVEPYALFLIASILVIIIVFPFFYNKSVLRPLKTLLNGVDQINQGNLRVKIPVKSQDELGVVTNHFNIMAQNLLKANNELKNYAEELENRVQKRTEELNSKTKLLEVQTQELERMDNFRSKLFMDISHELRTPITLVSGPIKNLLSKNNLGKEVEQQLKVSLRNSERLKKLVEQIIEINRLESHQLVVNIEKIDVCKKLDYLAGSYESLFSQSKIKFEKNIPSHSIELHLDVDKFEKIITNLISNAIKFTPTNGFVNLILNENENHIEINISDNGKGIGKDKLPSIFDRYQTSASDNPEYKEGLGVGLAITKEYVHLHSGEISVESKLGAGTTFTILFHKGTDHLGDIESVEESPKNSSDDFIEQSELLEFKNNEQSITKMLSTKADIHIVEDNSDMSDYIKGILENEGYKVSTSMHGQDALTFLESADPHLIISDIMMPVMDGMEFLEELRSLDRFKSTPTIFLSARSDLEGRLQGFRLGINDYLVKPFNTEELLCRITNLLEFSQTRKKTAIELSEEDGLSVDQEFINSLTILVEERMANTDFNVEELAAEVAMSRSTLYREIKKTTGLSAATFVKEIRLQKARQKLENRLIKNISELSYEVGFSTPSYFSKMYQKRFGKKPSSYLT